MTIIAMLLAKFLDPISFIVVLFISFITREKWIIPVAAIAGALVTETVLTSTQITRTWGQGLPIGIIASGLHAVLCYWLIGKFKKKNTVKIDEDSE